VGVQSSDHLADQDDPTLKGADRGMVNWVEGTRDAKLRDGLLCGAAGVEQELAELGHGAPPACLGYIRAYGEGSAHELITTLGVAGSAERAGDARGVSGERAGQFMDTQPSRMSLDHHAR
jgi:hypothetical protein